MYLDVSCECVKGLVLKLSLYDTLKTLFKRQRCAECKQLFKKKYSFTYDKSKYMNIKEIMK